MTSLIFYGGLRTIGGTIIAVEYKNKRVIFDFGLTYNPAGQVLDGQVMPRPSALTRDYLRLGLIPPIDGVYPQDSLPSHSSILSAQEYEGETAVLISHLHLDHMGAMGLIDPSIPVYMTKESQHLYESLHTIGEGAPGERTYQTCIEEQPFSIGEIIVTPLPVDHDIVGACAFHIETPEGSILYSGDVRLHGAHPDRIQSFVNQSKGKGFDVLIMEGTTLRNEEQLSVEDLTADASNPEDLLTEEKRVPEQIAKELNAVKGIGVFNIYHRNIERIQNMILAGKEASRTVVLEIETAEIASNHLEEANFHIYESEEIQEEKDNLPLWKRRLLEKYPTVSVQEINKNPEAYLLQNSYPNALELLDVNVESGIYIHSNGVPLGSFDPAYDNLHRLLDLIGLEKVQVDCGGHAIPQHLQYLVDELDPKILIPLHSFHPERLFPPNGKQFLPKYGSVYKLLNGDIFEE
ncbi:MBL fold metallo-hydrolase [Radiobacillus deserti]|uniref:MBL fold metallo-hydrolase n=1 Tax=Radiobacillus deserti TaxID=2594883 RepID=A0A516KKI8_9BACI|nr:MBL fold metallo-hydrolase [Radiobacillus deserti]QDP41913.1 MBL fold metallo-hydrolase [Radiobacillus deserti]